MSLQTITNDHVLYWKLADLRLEKPAISMSSQGVLYFYKTPESGHEYVVKLRPSAETLNLEREISFLYAAGELSVDVVSRIYNPRDILVGFGMPRPYPIDAAKLTHEQKYNIFNQIRYILPKLHNHGIIHGDIKLSNMLPDTCGIVKLCDFGTSAWMDEVYYPTAISAKWCSPYILDSAKQHRLVPEQDIYASGITVWELFTGETPFRDIDPDDEGDLEGQLRGGLRVDLERIEDPEVRKYIADYLEVMRKFE